MEQVIAQIGIKIRNLRKQQGLTVQDVAEKAEVSKGLISKIENNRTIPSLPVLLSIIDALDVPCNTFFGDIKGQPQVFYIHQRPSCYTFSKKENANVFHLLSKSFKASNIDFYLFTLDPNIIPKDTASKGFMMIYVLEGSAQYCLQDECVMVSAGDFLFFNAYITHKITSTSTPPPRFFVVHIQEEEK